MPAEARAALYARFSTDLQSDRSIEDQLALCEQYAAREGLTVTHRYEDRAKSSATLFGRDGLLSLIADAKKGEFDAVVVEALDRVSRNPADLHPLFQTLEFAGIKILEVNKGEADAMTVGLQGLFGQMFLDQLKAKTRRGLAGVIRDGRSAGGKSYGYATVPGEPGELVILEDEAKIVRRIFDEFVSGATTHEIVARLNAEGVPSPRGTLWRPNTLTGNVKRGYGILWNELYRGQRIWNRVRMVRDPETGKRVSRVNPQEEWHYQEAPHLRIVSDAVFKAARQRREAGMKLGKGRTKKPTRPFAGLTRCGHCGGTMTIRARRENGAVYIACTNATQAHTCHQKSMIRLDHIEAEIFDRLAELLRDPAYMQAYLTAYHEERARLAQENARDRGKLERAAIKARQAHARATELFIEGVTSGEEAKARIRELGNKADDAESLLASAAPPPEVITLHPQATKRYLAAIADLGPALADRSTAASTSAMQTIRELISEVHVFKGERGPQVTVYGYLAALLEPDCLKPVVAWGRFGSYQTAPLLSIAI